MTPTFYTYFSLLQKTLAAFNERCDCQGTKVNIKFKQSLSTDSDGNYDQWIAKFISKTFGNQQFSGSAEKVSELVTLYIKPLIQQILEACIANQDEWYNDKPEVKKELFDLQMKFTELNGSS